MDKIYKFEQYQGLNLDYSLIVNSTLDIKHGSILCINNEDADKLDYLINQALKKDVDKILTSSKSKISSEKVFRFGDYEKVFNDVLYNIYPSYKNKTYFGVTGTNGKTTTAYLLNSLLGDSSIFVGTIDDPDNWRPNGCHLGIESKISWEIIDDDLPQYRTEDDPTFIEANSKNKSR